MSRDERRDAELAAAVTRHAVIERFAGRVASLAHGGTTAGYLCAIDVTRIAAPRRWWRRAIAGDDPALGWLIEWTDPTRARDGHTDEAVDVSDLDDVLAVARAWDGGRHPHGAETLRLTWLDPSDAAPWSARFGWDDLTRRAEPPSRD